MEEIPSPPPAEIRPKTVAGQFVERIVAWVVFGGFLLGIIGVAFGLVATLFLGWRVGHIWQLSPLFTWFLVGTILGAVIGLLIGVISGVIRYWLQSDTSGGEKHPPPVSPTEPWRSKRLK
jgi:hypothetical protein